MASVRTASDPALSVRSRIYRTLYESGEFCSKQTLAESCGVSMPTIYQNLNELLDEGLVRYSGEGRSPADAGPAVWISYPMPASPWGSP